MTGLAVFLAAASAASASIIRVPEDHATIQAAIDAAQSGDVLEIADGTYAGPGNRDLVIVGKTLTIRSASGNAKACMIDCQPEFEYDVSNGFHVEGAATAGTRFESVTIANANLMEIFRGFYPAVGVRAVDTSVDLLGVRFVDCDGAGVACISSEVTITTCELNGAPPQLEFVCYGLASAGGSVVVAGCTFSECGVAVGAFQSQVRLTGSEVVGNTLGFLAYSSAGAISGSTISLNSGEASAGGGLSFHDSTFELENSRISGNEYTARRWGSGDRTLGGIRLSGTTLLTMRNCEVTGNRAVGRDGAGLYGTSPAVLLAEHCVIAGNHGWHGGGLAGTLHATLTNCIVWDNCATREGNDVYLVAGSAVRFECSDVDASGIAGPGVPIWVGTNLIVDPLFCEPKPCFDAPVADGVYTLRTRTSPAYDHPECGRIGLLAEGCTLAVVPESWSRIKARYR